MCRIGEYLAKVQEKKKKEKKGVIFSKTNTFLHTQYLRAYRTFAWTHTVHRRRSRTVCVTCKNKHTCALKCMFGYCFRHVHTCLPVESRCLSEVTDISVCLVCSRAIPQRPSRDISSQYLHEASETIAIYRPCFCWYSPGCQNHQRVHTNTGPLLQARKRIQSRRTTYSENGRGGEEVVGENWISPSLCLFLSAYHPLFFSLAVYLSLASPTPQYSTPFRDYLVFLLFHSARNPIKPGCVWKAAIQKACVCK